MKKIGLLLIGCLLFGLFMTSCAKKTEQILVGKWQEVNGREILEFHKDGTYQGMLVWDMTNQPIAVTGTYVVKGDLVDLNVQSPPNLTPMTWQVKLPSADELTVVFQQGGALKRDGGSLTYRRAK
jgi:hypothetical protein